MTSGNEIRDTELIIDQASKLDPMQTLVKMENESIASMAVARPRNMKAIMADLTEQLDAFPVFAESAVYVKPVGKDDRGQMQYARGLSIRAAEALAASFGYCRVETSVEPVDENHVRVSATFTDFQSGKIWRDSGIISRFYRDRFKKTVRHTDDRFYNVICKAELSKRTREVIVRSVSPGLRAQFQAAAERAMANVLTDETTGKMVNAFNAIGVDLVALEKFIGRSIKLGWTVDDRTKLMQVYNAIKENETTVAEVFSDHQQPADAQADSQAAAPVSLADAVKQESATKNK